MLYLACTMIFRVDFVHEGVSCAEDWVSMDCSTNCFKRKKKTCNFEPVKKINKENQLS